MVRVKRVCDLRRCRLARLANRQPCQGNFDGLATEWRLTVEQPFKAGSPSNARRVRGVKPSATRSRHSVTGRPFQIIRISLTIH
jgi:hypothetical protein